MQAREIEVLLLLHLYDNQFMDQVVMSELNLGSYLYSWMLG